MEAQLQPWQLLLLILAGWINRRQRDAIEYLLTEKRTLLPAAAGNRVSLH
jgi:putative transposase